MQTFDSFHRVYCFFLRSQLDSNYVKSIDALLERGPAPREVKSLIQEVKAFHGLRASLCGLIRTHLRQPELLSVLLKSRGLEQFGSVPARSTCALCGQLLDAKQGILLMVDGCLPYTVHSRYKKLVYNFWFLAHIPGEIGLEAKKWLGTQLWWVRGRVESTDACVERMSSYQDRMFSKKMYVKLKDITQYIQSELPALPINQTAPDVA